MNSNIKGWLSWIELLVMVAILGILAAVLIPTIGRVRECGPRPVEASNIRQIGQAALIYAIDNENRLPGLNLSQTGEIEEGGTTPNIHAIAAALARYGGLNDANAWIVREDRHPDVSHKNLRHVLDQGSPRTLSPEFARSALSVQFVAGLIYGETQPSTPVAFTRGLQPDGQWSADRHVSVHGEDRGYIVFIGGNVSHYRNLQEHSPLLMALDSKPTANILETIDDNARIFSYPATATGAVNGMPGIGRDRPDNHEHP